MLDKQRNKKIEPTENQNHPNLAMSEDFVIGTPEENIQSKVPGCFGNITATQYDEILRESSEARSTKPARTGNLGLQSIPVGVRV
jgi:hypothetical protein